AAVHQLWRIESLDDAGLRGIIVQHRSPGPRAGDQTQQPIRSGGNTLSAADMTPREVSSPFIAIACGGTGGHLFPGVAVAGQLLQRQCAVALLVSPKEVD